MKDKKQDPDIQPVIDHDVETLLGPGIIAVNDGRGLRPATEDELVEINAAATRR